MSNGTPEETRAPHWQGYIASRLLGLAEDAVVAEPWSHWYSLKAWKDLKEAAHIRDLFTCKNPGQNPDCIGLIGNSAERIADHVIPHRGDRRLFFELSNIQTLCKPCPRQVQAAARARGISTTSMVDATGGGQKEIFLRFPRPACPPRADFLFGKCPKGCFSRALVLQNPIPI